MILLTILTVQVKSYKFSASSDGCSAAVYRVLDDARRNVLYSDDEDLLCDDLLPPGWYRFMEAGRSRVLSDTCQQTCGTESPAWLDTSSLTNLTRDTQEGHVCVSWSWPGMSDCCLYTLPVTIKHCQDFIVYYLQPTQACNVAYCSRKGKRHVISGSTWKTGNFF